MRIIFFGSPAFALPALDALAVSPYRPLAVVTKPDQPQGRGLRLKPTAVRQRAESLGFPVHAPVSLTDSHFQSILRDLQPDLFVVVAFSILPKSLLAIPRRGSCNIHPSLLPAYRGAAPVERALLAGEERTGVSLIWLQEKIDRGPLISQEETPIAPFETAGELRWRLSRQGADLLLRTMPLVEDGSCPSVRQDDSLASWAPKIGEEDCRIRWEEPALASHNRVRALDPSPGAYTTWSRKASAVRLKIWRAHPLEEQSLKPGEVSVIGDRLVVGCGSGALAVELLQQEGKKSLEASAFLRGAGLRQGERWG
ncbi:MAG: methionyl-tRNA formyltransferase [Coprothermobacterota bacterium]|nr:methionyl-tRNA formyltransferase [Coprothermobacterota bacterium]